ncbi:molybdopterin-dependent oxidoreductase [Methanogenium cariaci]|uniref:molybdopterin-dependent oxidoreductase n=1 Tax=Methanogenium cariaci TaxID=2197 RepID=UPI001FDEFA22|nr:molybdopterin-dependent oxidoreductase [Methanogenium cariaci]
MGAVAADFVVVQDAFLTVTAQNADVVLPAAVFAETEGTVTNAERRVQRLHRAQEPPRKAQNPPTGELSQTSLLPWEPVWDMKHPRQSLPTSQRMSKDTMA